MRSKCIELLGIQIYAVFTFGNYFGNFWTTYCCVCLKCLQQFRSNSVHSVEPVLLWLNKLLSSCQRNSFLSRAFRGDWGCSQSGCRSAGTFFICLHSASHARRQNCHAFAAWRVLSPQFTNRNNKSREQNSASTQQLVEADAAPVSKNCQWRLGSAPKHENCVRHARSLGHRPTTRSNLAC